MLASAQILMQNVDQLVCIALLHLPNYPSQRDLHMMKEILSPHQSVIHTLNHQAPFNKYEQAN